MNRRDKCSIYIEKSKNIVQIVAFLAAGIWGYLTFVSPESFRPNDYKPHLFVEIKTESIRALKDRAFVTISFHVTNQSKRFIRNVASYYDIIGQADGPVGKIDLESVVRKLDEDNELGFSVIHRRNAEVLRGGQIVPPQWWFAPGEKHIKQIVVSVPYSVPHKVDLISVIASITYHEEDEKEEFDVKWYLNEDGLPEYEVEPVEGKSGLKSKEETSVVSSRATSEIYIPWQ